MRTVRTALKLRMELDAYVKIMPGYFYCLHPLSVRGCAADQEAICFKPVPVAVVKLIAVAVTFVDRFLSVQPIGFGGFVQDAGIRTETQGSADILDVVLVRHQMDDRVAGVRIQFRGVGVTVTNDIAGKLQNGHLHYETQDEERD